MSPRRSSKMRRRRERPSSAVPATSATAPVVAVARLAAAAILITVSSFVTAFIPRSTSKKAALWTGRSTNTAAFAPIRRYPHHRPAASFLAAAVDDNDDDDDEALFDDDLRPPPAVDGFDDTTFFESLSRPEVEALTVSQLKQQLRLRGKKISGRKAELVDRLLGGPIESNEGEEEATTISPADVIGPDRRGESRRRSSNSPPGADRAPVDVTAYLDEDDVGKDVKSSTDKSSSGNGDGADENEEGDESGDGSSSSYRAETWGEEARIVDDYEGRSVVVDCLSRTVIEFKGARHDDGNDDNNNDQGHNQTSSSGSSNNKVRAYVSASRDALRAYLAGGDSTANATDTPSSQVRDIQERREEASRVTMKDFDDVDLPDTGDEAGHYQNVLERDYGDWGVYSPTGAQLSAQEVQGVLLLSDVRGPFHPDTQTLVDKIAFECQPVVVMAPDLFRDHPWQEEPKSPGFNARGESYEEWRSNHADSRVNVDIRAAASVLRRRYGVSSVAVFGTCYGGGRALEAAAGWQPDGCVAVDGTDGDASRGEEEGGANGPPPVDPSACIAWYPTRYDAAGLFGPDRGAGGKSATDNGANGGAGSRAESIAVMAIFAGEDTIPGARPDDAEKLKDLLEADDRVKDRMVKVFPKQRHGFAHVGMGRVREEEQQERDDGDNDGESSSTTTTTFLEEEFGGAGAGGSLSMDSGDAEVACLLSTAWMETYTRDFLPTTGMAVKDDEDAKSWSEDLEMQDLTEANNRDIRKELEEAVKNHEDLPPDLKRMPSYQYGNEIEEVENMAGDLPTSEEPPRPAWDEKLIEVAEDLKRIGVEPDDDDETYLGKIKDAYDDGKLQSWLGDIDMENPPEVPRSDMGYDEEFGGKFIEAMDDMSRIGLEKGDDMSTVVKKFKGALDRGDLKRLQDLRADRARRKLTQKAGVEAKRAATMEQLKSIGVLEDDDLDTTYKKLKQAIDRGEFDKLRNGVPQGATGVGGGGRLWEDEEEGPW